jgi:cysteine desulfurase / selenocysteine lyase
VPWDHQSTVTRRVSEDTGPEPRLRVGLLGLRRLLEQRLDWRHQVLSLDSIRDHYPILGSDAPPVYLDSAATALKPQPVIDAVVDVLAHKTANIHRSVHHLGDLATNAYEDSRRTVADFIGAQSHEVVFVRNTTEALNLVARGWKQPGRTLVSWGDHYSNVLPWDNNVHRLKPTKDGLLDLDALNGELQSRDVSMVSVAHVSNVTGQRNDISQIAELCRSYGAALTVDAAQSVPHEPIDVDGLDCDFLAFSGHKLGAPTGVGVLYGKAEALEKIDWHLKGGSTVEQVHSDKTVPKEIPWRFEAGTPAVESVVGLAACIDFLQSIGIPEIERHQRELVRYALEQIVMRLPQVSVVGPIEGNACGPISIVQRSVNPHSIARSLSDRHRICVRSGYHCSQPLHEHLSIPASLRISAYLYNTKDEIDTTIEAIKRLLSIGHS